jgi:acyl-CoA thioester hydrolase
MAADERAAPIFFFAPFVSSTMRIEPPWIDYNGHMNMAFYHVLFDRGVDEAFAILGVGQDYVEERRASMFTAEVHTVYRRELKLDDTVRVTLQLIDFDEKRLHFYQEVRHASEGWVAATCENMSLHVDFETRRVAAFPADIQDNLAVMKTAHARLSRPSALGRVMAIPRQGRTEPARAQQPMMASGVGTRH